MVNMEGFLVVEEVLEAMGEDLEDYTVMEEILEEVVNKVIYNYMYCCYELNK